MVLPPSLGQGAIMIKFMQFYANLCKFEHFFKLMVLPPPRYRPDDDQHDMKWLLLFQR